MIREKLDRLRALALENPQQLQQPDSQFFAGVAAGVVLAKGTAIEQNKAEIYVKLVLQSVGDYAKVNELLERMMLEPVI